MTRNTSIASDVIMADTFWSRFAGLIPRSYIKEGEGLMITRCNSIHMFFMRFAIDAIFTDKNFKVVSFSRNIKPWQLSPIFFGAYYCLEVAPGTIERSQTTLGDTLEVRPARS
jgi:uncharacterized membrane protein (UPF0127 family)